MRPLPGIHYTPRRGIGADDEGRKVPLWAAMVALVGTAFLFGRK